MPFISQVAVGKHAEVKVFGNDYNTRDGTCIRDYIHILDVASGHSAALKKIQENPGLKIYNLGTGKGYTVLEMIKAFEKASNKTVQINFFIFKYLFVYLLSKNFFQLQTIDSLQNS